MRSRVWVVRSLVASRASLFAGRRAKGGWGGEKRARPRQPLRLSVPVGACLAFVALLFCHLDHARRIFGLLKFLARQQGQKRAVEIRADKEFRRRKFSRRNLSGT